MTPEKESHSDYEQSDDPSESDGNLGDPQMQTDSSEESDIEESINDDGEFVRSKLKGKKRTNEEILDSVQKDEHRIRTLRHRKKAVKANIKRWVSHGWVIHFKN